MRARSVLPGLVSVCLLLPALLAAQPWPSSDGNPSVTDPSIPLTYVGGDGSVSIGVNREGETEGQLMGVFARSNLRAVIGQAWWDRSGAGGVQGDYNWLWGQDAQAAREHPDQVTVARLAFAVDQNAGHDRKATIGFGIERRDFALEGYLAHGISSGRIAGHSFDSTQTTLDGVDDIGSFTEVETTTIDTLFERRPYGREAGIALSHVFEPLALRLHGGASVQDGDGARADTLSLGIDTPLGTRGWGLSALAEHVRRDGDFVTRGDDTRVSAYLRYEFGGRGPFVPTSTLQDPAWIARALGRPSTAHPRTVDSYRTVRSRNVVVTRGGKQYDNHFPLARADSATTTAGQPVAIAVLANDTDPDGDALAVAGVTAPAHGSATIQGALVAYVPAAGFTGTDQFGYTVSDGHGGSAMAPVTVVVGAGITQAPVARDDAVTTPAGQAVTIDVLDNDTDADGDALQLLAVTPPANGSARIDGDRVIYTPLPGFSGSDAFTYTVGDGHGGSASANVQVLVLAPLNGAPIARDDATTITAGGVSNLDVLDNDSDPDGDPLAIARVTAPLSGTATVVGNRITYTPAAGFTGIDRFGYTVTDGRGGSARATVTVTVVAAPNRPPVAVDDAAATIADTAVTIDVLGNDADPDGDALAITALAAPASGTAAVIGNQVAYTPAPGFTGTDRFGYTVDDGRGGSASAIVTVTVAPAPNRPPVAVDDAASTAAGAAVTIDVLANDSDPDGDALSVTAVTAPSGGIATVSGNAVVYVPAAGFSGTDRFGYTIGDGRGGTASAFVTVVGAPPPNRPPVAVDDAASTAAGAAVTIDVLANDSDPDGDALSVTAVTAPAGGTATVSGNAVVYVPAAGFSGTDRFSYTIDDGRGGTASALVTVVVAPPPNRPPVAQDDDVVIVSVQPVLIDVLANDSDPDADPLVITAVTTPPFGSAVVSGGSILYTPGGNFPGIDSFSYTISDGRGGTDTAVVTITFIIP